MNELATCFDLSTGHHQAIGRVKGAV